MKIRNSIFKNNIQLLVLFLSACNSSEINEKNCESIYNKAVQECSNFYVSKERVNLKNALSATEFVYGHCDKFRFRAGDLKLRLFLLLEEYERGEAFVDSINESDFSKPYQKNLYLYTFKGLHSQKNGDTLKANKYFEGLAKEIGAYLSNASYDREAVADLFYTKIRYLNTLEVTKQLDSMMLEENSDKVFLKDLKMSLEQNIEVSSFVQ